MGTVVKVTVDVKLGVPAPGLNDELIRPGKQQYVRPTFGIPIVVLPGVSVAVSVKLTEFPGILGVAVTKMVLWETVSVKS
jgi:hypothetical protein